jgi:hypothetical protein
MNTNLMPANVQKQHDLQFDLVNELLQMDEDATSLDADARAKLTELRRLSIELQRAPYDDTSTAADDTANNDFWQKVLDFIIKQGMDQVNWWMQPGRSVPLFNASGAPIFIRTFDQRDNLRWIPYATYSIAPNQLGVIAARGTTYIQLDIRGRIYQAQIGVAQAFDGSRIRVR